MIELEPRSLGVPLYRRDWTALWYAVAGVGCAWLWSKPTRLSDIIVSSVVGGTAFWLCLGPGLNQLRYHQSRPVRAATFAASVVVLFAVMQYLVPALSNYVAKIAA